MTYCVLAFFFYLLSVCITVTAFSPEKPLAFYLALLSLAGSLSLI